VGQELVVYDPANGEILWDQRGISGGYACSTPAYDAGRKLLYCFAGGSHGTTTASAVKATDEVRGNRFLWKHGKIGSALTPPVFYNDRLYYGGYGGTRPKGVESIGALAPETGEPIFKVKPEDLTQKSEIYATPLAGDGKVYLQTRENGTFVLDATTPEYNLLAINVLDDEVAPMGLGERRRQPETNIFNSEPVPLEGGRLLLRSYWGLHCIEAGE
jgi:outer membrane protein assembly factor BamB